MNEITLYRAADDDFAVSICSFAADIADARQYLHNQAGYGGDTLYRATVEIVDEELLDLYYSTDPLSDLLDLCELDDDGRDVFGRIADTATIDALHARGYRWIRIEGSYPEGCEVYTWLGWVEGGPDEPTLEEV